MPRKLRPLIKKTVTFWGRDTRTAKDTTYYIGILVFKYINKFVYGQTHGLSWVRILHLCCFADGLILMINFTCVGAGHRWLVMKT